MAFRCCRCLLSPSRCASPTGKAERPCSAGVLLSPGGERTRSSSGLTVDVDAGLDDARADAVVLLASYKPERMVSEQLTAWLRRRAAEGAIMGCVDTGALVFAKAGLLRRRPAAVHYEAIAGLREVYGQALFTDRLFDMDHDRCSSAGGVATFDMTLALIERFTSRQLTRRIAEILNYQPIEHERARGYSARTGRSAAQSTSCTQR